MEAAVRWVHSGRLDCRARFVASHRKGGQTDGQTDRHHAVESDHPHHPELAQVTFPSGVRNILVGVLFAMALFRSQFDLIASKLAPMMKRVLDNPKLRVIQEAGRG